MRWFLRGVVRQAPGVVGGSRWRSLQGRPRAPRAPGAVDGREGASREGLTSTPRAPRASRCTATLFAHPGCTGFAVSLPPIRESPRHASRVLGGLRESCALGWSRSLPCASRACRTPAPRQKASAAHTQSAAAHRANIGLKKCCPTRTDTKASRPAKWNTWVEMSSVPRYS